MGASIPVKGLKAQQLTHQSVYVLLGGPGIIYVDGIPLFIVFDYVHIFKNVRNNWYTEVTGQLAFSLLVGETSSPCMKKIRRLQCASQN